jgi:hypothetical protein
MWYLEKIKMLSNMKSYQGRKNQIKYILSSRMMNQKVVYNIDVVFRETKYVFKHEVLPRKEEPKKVYFELKDDESDSTKEHELHEEYPHTPLLRRLVQKEGNQKGILNLIFVQFFLCF